MILIVIVRRKNKVEREDETDFDGLDDNEDNVRKFRLVITKR